MEFIKVTEEVGEGVRRKEKGEERDHQGRGQRARERERERVKNGGRITGTS